MDEDGRITVADLPDSVRGWTASLDGPSVPPPSYEIARERAMEEFSRRYVRKLLDFHGGNVTRAATAAGVSRRTVHRWLAELGGPPQENP